jgi:predicted nuclease of predicted toxin-antitoxin system
MAKSDLYNIDLTTPVQVTRELYNNVGSGVNIVGDFTRGFYNATDFEIWDSAVGGTQLIEGTDYDLVNKSIEYSAKAGQDVYAGYQITNVTYQTGNIYITYKTIGTFFEKEIIDDLQAQITAIPGSGTTEIKTVSYTILDGDNVSKIFFNASTTDMTATLPTLADNQNRLLRIENDTELTISGCTTNSATAVVTMASTTGLLAGMNVYGNNVNSAITISSVDSGIQITLSANCNKTETGTAILSFANTVIVDGEGAETIDGLTTIELSRGGDFIEIQGLSDEWKILNEKISCQLWVDVYAGYGSPDTQIMRFSNNREYCGNLFTQNHDSGYNGNTEGLEIRIKKPGKYEFHFSTGGNSGSSNYIGLSLNSNQLTTPIYSLNVQDRKGLDSSAPAVNASSSVSVSKYFVIDDIIRAHASGTTISDADLAHFIVTYMGN